MYMYKVVTDTERKNGGGWVIFFLIISYKQGRVFGDFHNFDTKEKLRNTYIFLKYIFQECDVCCHDYF
jgi:hypothetical protein